MKCDDCAVLFMEVAEDWLEVGKRFVEPEEVADDREGDGSRREFSGGFGFGLRREEKGEDGFEEERDTEGDEDEIPCFHFVFHSHTQHRGPQPDKVVDIFIGGLNFIINLVFYTFCRLTTIFQNITF